MAAALALGGCGEDRRQTVTLYAAASLGPALQEICESYEREHAVRVRGDWAASSVQARRIRAGAPVHVFVSAHPRWLDRLEEARLLVAGTRRDLLGNALVIVAPKDRPFTLSPGQALGDAFDGRLALADPDHVPAGVYAREALSHAGWWKALVPRIVPAADVRAALALVERGECAAGIVYATDAAASAHVDVAWNVPEDWHTPVVYAVALVRPSRPAIQLYQHLLSSGALDVFARHGFRTLAPAESSSAPGASPP